MQENVFIVAVAAYFLGSIPFGVVLARLCGTADPRSVGSGNIGATNMLRTGNKKLAALTLLLDAGKGALAVWLAYRLFPASESALALTLAAIGHMASPWLKFTGGKGVATLLGGALAFAWPVGVASCCLWLLAYITTRYVSLASITALALLPLATWLRVDGVSAALVGVACGFAIYKHRSNIARLRAGFEPKMGR